MWVKKESWYNPTLPLPAFDNPSLLSLINEIQNCEKLRDWSDDYHLLGFIIRKYDKPSHPSSTISLSHFELIPFIEKEHWPYSNLNNIEREMNDEWDGGWDR